MTEKEHYCEKCIQRAGRRCSVYGMEEINNIDVDECMVRKEK